VECAGYDTSNLRECRVTFGGVEGRMVGAAPWRVMAIVPNGLEGGEAEVVLESRDGWRSEPTRVVVGRELAEDLHMVANPAVDPDDGSVYVTRSGSRGQRMPVSLYRIDPRGDMSGVTGEITNPTGIAFDSLGQMFVTSRMDGTVYRVTPFHEVVPFVRDLGVATGLAFDRAGRMYVGDRTGTIHRARRGGRLGAARTFGRGLPPRLRAGRRIPLRHGPDRFEPRVRPAHRPRRPHVRLLQRARAPERAGVRPRRQPVRRGLLPRPARRRARLGRRLGGAARRGGHERRRPLLQRRGRHDRRHQRGRLQSGSGRQGDAGEVAALPRLLFQTPRATFAGFCQGLCRKRI
jgi:hypothetical protein